MVMFFYIGTLLVLGCMAGLPDHEKEEICDKRCTFLKSFTDHNSIDLKTIQCTYQCYKPECLEKCVKGYDLNKGDMIVLLYIFQECVDECLKKPTG